MAGALLSALLRTGAGMGRQGIAGVLPTGEQRVLNSLRMYGQRMFEPEAAQGITLDLRRGQNVNVGEFGNMMSRIPNPADQSNVVRNVDELVSYVRNNPPVMRELQRGGYAGGWQSDELGGFVFDPARRYMTRTGATVAGAPSGQLGGFGLRRGEEFALTPESVSAAQRRMGRVGNAGLGGVVGSLLAAPPVVANAMQEDATLGDQLAAGGVGALGALGALGIAAASRGRIRPQAGMLSRGGATSRARRGILDPDVLASLAQLGVREGAEGGAGLAGKVAKDRATAIGIPAQNLADVADTADEVTAFSRAYEEAYKQYGQVFGKTTPAQRAAFLADFVPKAGTVPMPAPATLSSEIATAFSKNATKAKMARPNFDDVAKVEKSSSVSDEYTSIGVTPVRHASNSQDLANLARNGEVNRLAQAAEDIQSNLMKFITPDDLADIQRRNGVPVFYILHSLGTRARAAASGVPLMRMLGAQGPSSAAAGPITEVSLANAALNRTIVDDLLAKGKVKAASGAFPTDKNSAAYKAFVAERAKGIKGGDLMQIASPGNKPGKVRESVDTIENDIVKFLNDPTSVPNIQEKVWTYLGTTGSPLQKVVSTMDSWMFRAAFGNKTHSTAGNTLEYKLLHEVFNDLARRLGVPPAALQEAIWKNVRVATETVKDEAFLPLSSRRYEYPNLSTSAVQIPKELPTFTKMSSSAKFRKENRRFADKLVKAVQDNPAIADMFEIVGEDVQFTDKFFTSLIGL